jgi:hypothetical protein
VEISPAGGAAAGSAETDGSATTAAHRRSLPAVGSRYPLEVRALGDGEADAVGIGDVVDRGKEADRS